MNNFIVVGDMHIRYTAPSFRKSTFYSELLNKIDQINKLARQYNADVICLGDLFNSYVEDYFELISYDLINRIKGWYSLIGNHDCKTTNGDLRGTSFGTLKAANIIKLGLDFAKKYNNDKVEYHFFDYYNRQNLMKKQIISEEDRDKKVRIAFIHDYVMPKGTKENFEYKECEENDYNIVFCGHYHYPFDCIVGRTRYINPGSLMRLTISEVKLNRVPEVILYNSNKIEHIKLKCSSIDDIVIETNSVTEKFESKFAEMLLENDLSCNDNNIVNLLKKNNVDKNIIDYIENKSREVL